jgi:hypothetical protein
MRGFASADLPDHGSIRPAGGIRGRFAAGVGQPNVNANASAPWPKNSMSNHRSTTGFVCLISALFGHCAVAVLIDIQSMGVIDQYADRTGVPEAVGPMTR